MTAQLFQTELANLIQESKRKNSDVKHAAEQSLTELKALPLTSEAQLTADLLRKPHFGKPFILACKTRHQKLTTIGVTCIQRLVAIHALPHEKLRDVLDGLSETATLGLDVQLRVLQTLPSLFQYYSDDLNGDLLAATFELCSSLQNCKTAAVSNTAAATIQQLVVSVFEKIARFDGTGRKSPSKNISINGQKATVTSVSYDGLRILQDFCNLLEDGETEFIKVQTLPKPFVLELLESVLADNAKLILHHPEQAQVLESRLMPLIIKFVSDWNSFPIIIRAARLLSLLLKDYMSVFPDHCESALDLLIRQLDPEHAAPWKRIVSMEIFRNLYSKPKLVRQIFYQFDEQEGHKNIMRDLMACMVRLASEKPSVIGVGHQSTLPTGPVSARDIMDETVTLETGVAGVIGSGTGQMGACGVSTQFSLVRSPFLEMLDKQDAPPFPETYIYSLVLNCIGAFADSLAKFILPLTVPDMKNKRRLKEKPSGEDDESNEAEKVIGNSRVPLNPLDLESHPQIQEVHTCAMIVEECWPAVLATCSTFLHAALDNDFYHNLVRSFQKIAHVAGLLRLATPRDAFLTTLGKAAVPADVLCNATGSRGGMTYEPLKTPAAVDTLRTSSEAHSNSFSTRNLLCLRALLNLGIALGATLNRDAWFIIIETLWYADLVVGISTKSTAKLSDRKSIDTEHASAAEVSRGTFGNETLAVQTAATKMFESSAEYPDPAFKSILLALLTLSGFTRAGLPPESFDISSPRSPLIQPTSTEKVHQNRRSISMTVSKPRIQEGELKFVLEKIADLSTANFSRLSSPQDDQKLWAILSSSLIAVTGNDAISLPLRAMAGNILDLVVFNAIKTRVSDDDAARGQVQLRGLSVLTRQISGLYASRPSRNQSASSRTAAFEVHGLALETLRSILEECGETLVAGWELVFELISSVFYEGISEGGKGSEKTRNESAPEHRKILARSPKLIRTSYKSLQLLSSDFLASLPSNCLLNLIIAFYNFAAQEEDFNISLTSTTSFWTVSDFLRSQTDNFSIEDYVPGMSTEEMLASLAVSPDLATSRNALWMALLLRMVDLSSDSRSEIRNSVVQTVTRIVDAYGQHLSPRAWAICLHRILFAIAAAILRQITEAVKEKRDAETLRTTVESAVLEIKALSNIIGTYFDSIILDDTFTSSWNHLLNFFNSMIQLNSLELSEAVFTNFRDLLSHMQSSKAVAPQQLQSAWSCWAKGHPVSVHSTIDLDAPNQGALQAYLLVFQELYRLIKDDMTEDYIVCALANFRTAITGSVLSRYSTDVDHLTEVQKLVLSNLRTLCSDKPSSQRFLLQCLSVLCDSALTGSPADQDKRLPTLVAFSKAVAELLAWHIREQGIVVDLLAEDALALSLDHLVNLINSKYTFLGVDKEPSLWRVATTASLDILRVALPWVERKYESSSEGAIRRFWKSIVDIAKGIAFADFTKTPEPPRTTIFADEEFDISSFNALKQLVIPSLGSSSIPNEIRYSFAFAILTSSFIYPPQFNEFSTGNIQQQPLNDLYKVRMGRTYDPPPNMRSRLAYVLLDTLFELSSEFTASPLSSSVTEDDTSYIHLAAACSPSLILRAAISLKSYIADQPLRGLMPQPASARKELLYILEGLSTLKCNPLVVPSQYGIADAPKPSHQSKKHLTWLYPLIVQAVQVAGKAENDHEILARLTRLMDVLHKDIRVCVPGPNMWAVQSSDIQYESHLLR